MASNKEPFYADIMVTHSQVTGSCIYVTSKIKEGSEIRFVVDCGLFQERDTNELNTNLPFNPEKLDFVLVTHNHIDHIGRLPYLVKKGFCKEIYVSEQTAQLMPLALGDALKILREQAKRKDTRPLYDEYDHQRTLKLITPVMYNKIFRPMEGVKVTFINNGHLIGAAMILVQISYRGHGTINLLFTGDYNGKNMFFKIPKIRKNILELPLTVIQESTYGNMESSEIKQCFKENIEESFKKTDKDFTVICPVFSLGRAQEILYELKCMKEEGRLSPDVEIFFDGKLAQRYTNLYLSEDLGISEKMKDFLPENLRYVDKALRTDIVHREGRKIIVTSSGMGSYGPAHTYIQEYITHPNALIHFTGYTAEGTLGRKLKDAPVNENIEISGIVMKKRARVEYTNEYSAHAKADEMISFLQQFKQLKLVLVNHGESEVKQNFANRILDEVDTKYVGILSRENYFRINPYGLVKSFSSKF